MRPRAVLAVLVAGLPAVLGSGSCTGRGGAGAPVITDVVEPSTSIPVRPPGSPPRQFSVLLFHRTEGFAHDAIPAAVGALRDQLLARGAVVQASDDPAALREGSLAGLDTVVFLMTTADVLDDTEQVALEQFVRGGGGFVGVHSALDTEYEWPFYGTLIGAWFARHPAVQPAVVHPVASPTTGWPGSVSLPAAWTRIDEWYDTQTNPRPDVRVLATVDEATYEDGGMGADHPIEWCRDVDAGRSFVTAMGHTGESWADGAFVAHVADAVQWSATPSARCA